MPAEKPIVYILLGDDREAIEAHIHRAYASLGTPDMAALNTTHLEGRSSTLNDLRASALALPFLTKRRLVVVDDALKLFAMKVSGKEQAEDKKFHSEFLALLDSLPQSTALILVISDTQKKRKRNGVWDSYWQTLGKNHWLIKWAESAGDRVYIEDCALPTGGGFVNWIQDKAVELGGEFTSRAARTLAEYLGNDTQRAAQEIEKLLTYVNFDRPVDSKDVQLLSIQENQSDIFEMVDALGTKDGKKAITQLHLLLEDSDFIPIFLMIVRQFRLILQTKEILDGGGNDRDVAKILRQQPFVARKLCAQAQHFDIQTLESIYYQLQKIDIDMKTGGMQGDIALDLFIARLTNALV
ncbi:MAG: DNA polymerase III subunit delta [Chloroflexota bacterium]|nr:DNA polymerase III subunit delta [Chloroflexota bacterium]